MLSKELRFLILASRQELTEENGQQLQPLLTEVNWDHLLFLAKRHRLVSLLYQTLKSLESRTIPSSILENLKNQTRNNAQKSLRQTGELIKCMQLF